MSKFLTPLLTRLAPDEGATYRSLFGLPIKRTALYWGVYVTYVVAYFCSDWVYEGPPLLSMGIVQAARQRRGTRKHACARRRCGRRSNGTLGIYGSQSIGPGLRVYVHGAGLHSVVRTLSALHPSGHNPQEKGKHII